MLKLNMGNDKPADINKIYDAVIIGSGPAGLTAALYLGRARQSVLVIEEMISGGQASTTDKLENYPGFPEGIGGMELMQRMEDQAKHFSAEYLFDKVESVDLKSDIKKIKTSSNKEIQAKTVIISTGAHPRTIKAPGSDKFHGKGISYCATCDGPLFRDKDVVVVGGGNSAVEEGLFITRFVKSITYVQDLPFLTAEKILQERLKEHENITIHTGNLVTAFNGNEQLESITVKNSETGEEKKIECQGVFVYIGYIPNTGIFSGQIEMDKAGYIITDEDLHTNIEGVFAAGDVRVKTLRQVVTAVADGAIAAFNVTKYLENKQ